MTVEELRAVLDDHPDDMVILLCVAEVPYLPVETVKIDDHMGGGPPVLLLVADMSYA